MTPRELDTNRDDSLFSERWMDLYNEQSALTRILRTALFGVLMLIERLQF